MTLWDLQQGESATVEAFSTKLPTSYATRLGELGFKSGNPIACVLVTQLGAPRLYQVDNAVYSLDDKIAKLIKLSSQR